MIQLSFEETRILGVLFEKERATPDQYPLSLNSLTLGCNQKSNREPVVQWSESEVQVIIDSLIEKGFVAEQSFKSRVAKYRQRLGNTQFSSLNISIKEQSILTVMFLRGPQTPGELRSRTNRLCEFNHVDEVESVLNDLIEQGYVAKLPREPGKRESRYAHLFSGEVSVSPSASSDASRDSSNASFSASDHNHAQLEERIDQLEEQVTALEKEVDDLKSMWT